MKIIRRFRQCFFWDILLTTYEMIQGASGQTPHSAEKDGDADAAKRALIPYGHTTLPVSLTVLVDANGCIRGVAKRKSTIIIPCTEESMGRTIKPVPHPLFDQLQYVDSGRSPEKTSMYLQQLAKWKGDDAKLEAVFKCVSEHSISEAAAHYGVELTDKDDKAGVCFEVQIGLEDSDLSNDVDIRNRWIAYLQRSQHRLGKDVFDEDLYTPTTNFPKKVVSSDANAKLLSANDSTNSIEQYRYMGVALKENVNRFEDEFALFRNVISESVSRPLKTLHLQSAFYMYKMARAANFSVPGAGKTAMVLGVFAYLNSGKAKFGEFVSRILVVSPINAFESWKSEFQKTFGPKKKLRVVDVQDGNFDGDLRRRWAVSNLVLVNYESLPKYHDQLIDLIDGQTMIVFDEVHRIKGVNATRATAAMDLCDKAFFRYVLTGTPIPNSYCDIYNFLHLLYKKEYPVFFGWDVPELSKANQYLVDRINEKLYPFFWRTNKGQLGVPPADPDDIIEAPASSGQLELALAIWTQEKSSLAKLIRLMQASTNPSLLKEKIDFRTLGLESNGEYSEEIDEKTFNRALMHEETAVTSILSNKCYEDFDLDNMKSPKFEEGLKLIRDLVNQGKKVR